MLDIVVYPAMAVDGFFNLRNLASQVRRSRRSDRGIFTAPRSENLGTNGEKIANLIAKHKESIKIPDFNYSDGSSCRISEFLQHPSGVESILNIRTLRRVERLEMNTFSCTLPTIQFLKFEVTPVIVLRVTTSSEDCVVEMLSCKFQGSEVFEAQSHRFTAAMRNHITWDEDAAEPSLSFDVDLRVALEIYTKPFTMLPISAVEKPGSLIMQGLIDRLVPLLVEQLLEDYRNWVAATVTTAPAP
ncbi:DUF1997 family protein, putative (DUF1997) isoform X2 [Wolffia australiana]